MGNERMDHEPDSEPCRMACGRQYGGVLDSESPCCVSLQVWGWSGDGDGDGNGDGSCVAALVRCSQSLRGGLLLWIFSKVRGAHGLCCSG